MALVFTPTSVAINDLFGNDIKFIIPPYQRPYSWDCIGKSDKNNQVNVMWDDLIDAFENRHKDDYFFGSMVMIQDDREYVVIDGQQRLTTMVLLFTAIKCFLQKLVDNQSLIDAKGEELLEIDNFAKRGIETITDVIFNKETFGLKQIKKLRIEKNAGFDLDFDIILSETLGCGPIDKKKYEDLDEEKSVVAARYFNNRDFFIERLLSKFMVKGKFNRQCAVNLDEFTNFIKNKVSVVRINTDQFNTAYKIFEILNNRGLPLSNKDLLRNLIIQEFDSLKSKGGVYKDIKPEEKWNHLENDFEFQDDFVGRWVESTNATQQKYSAYNDLTEIYDKKYIDTLNNKKIELLYNDLERDLKYFSMFYDDSITWLPLKGKINFLLNAPNLRYTLNLLIAAFRHYKYDGGENINLKKFVTAYERYVIYLLLHPMADRFSSKPIYKAIHELNNNQPGNAIKVFLHSTDGMQAIDDKLIEDILNLSIHDNYIAKLLIAKYVWYKEGSSSEDVINQYLDFDKSTLEHICPQEIKRTGWEPLFGDKKMPDIRYKLGNMTLLTQRLNSSAKNADWIQKRIRYEKTKLFITQELVGIDTITPEVIIKRQKKIVDGIMQDLKM
jgi:uncharacterized protein with ParB-like and HNH nuclease domain